MANPLNAIQSYLELYLNSYKAERTTENVADAIIGTCNSMCPDEEMFLRNREHMVHVLEVVGKKQKMVKCYSRPAADTNPAVAHNLRPFPILKETVDYLLFEASQRTDAPLPVVYNFVTDRLRAVRQDMIIQDLHPRQKLALLEPMIRFYIFFGYLLSDAPANEFSPTLNRGFLMECLKTCLQSYDDLEANNEAEEQNTSYIIHNPDYCILGNKDEEPGKNRNLIEALYLVTNLFEESPIMRHGNLNENIRHTPIVRRAYKLAVAALHGHYVTVCKFIPQLCPLTLCAVAFFLPKLQRRTLQVLSVAYSCRGRCVPLKAVREWLGAADDDAARTVIRHYGLAETDGQVACLRSSFRNDAPLLPPRKIRTQHLEDKMNLVYVLTYTPCDP